MSVALQDLEGVESVEISLTDGAARIVLKPENTVTLADLRTVVRKRGFTPKEAHLTARGTITVSAGAATFEALGTGETFVADDGTGRPLDRYAGRVVTVEGLVPAPDTETRDRIEIEKVREPTAVGPRDAPLAGADHGGVPRSTTVLDV